MISSAFVESAVNRVVSKRMVKEQQLRWIHQPTYRRPDYPHFLPHFISASMLPLRRSRATVTQVLAA